jgi:hypothetical protein
VIGDAGCVDLEKPLPADLPLHQRGFGVLEEAAVSDRLALPNTIEDAGNAAAAGAFGPPHQVANMIATAIAIAPVHNHPIAQIAIWRPISTTDSAGRRK